tara:strand:- start:388 stop:576 length:189 start_codon:yes stop_codon:yes gene_type:complete
MNIEMKIQKAEKKIESAVIALGEAKYADCKGTTQHWLAIGTKFALEAGDILRKYNQAQAERI